MTQLHVGNERNAVMKTKWRLITVLTLVTFIANAATPAGVEIRIADKTPNAIIDHYEDNVPETAEDAFTLALALFSEAKFREAIDWANRAIPQFQQDKQKSLCYQLIAQAYGAMDDFDRAARAATEGQRHDPESQTLAALRVVYYDKLGDQLNHMIANEHLMRLNPIYEQDPKMDPVTGAVIIVGMVCLVAGGALYVIKTESDPETKRRLAEAVSGVVLLANQLAMIAPLGKIK